jgi:hypothetical protein
MLFVDVETLGLKPGVNPITGIGAVDSNNTRDRFMAEVQVLDGAQMCASALNYQKYTPENVEALRAPWRKDINVAIGEFVKWYVSHDDQTFAGQNPLELDRPMLLHAAEQAGIEVQLGHRSFDLQSAVMLDVEQAGFQIPLAKKRSAVSSNFIQDYLGLPREQKPHIGIMGALWEADAHNILVHGEHSVDALMKYKLPTRKHKQNEVYKEFRRLEAASLA